MSHEVCPRCFQPVTRVANVDAFLNVDGTVHACNRKLPGEKHRRLVHVLLTDGDYLRLLTLSEGRPLSDFCREAVREKLDAIEATPGTAP